MAFKEGMQCMQSGNQEQRAYPCINLTKDKPMNMAWARTQCLILVLLLMQLLRRVVTVLVQHI